MSSGKPPFRPPPPKPKPGLVANVSGPQDQGGVQEGQVAERAVDAPEPQDPDELAAIPEEELEGLEDVYDPQDESHVKVVRALYRYDAQQNDELTFDEGDLLYILDMSNPAWWKAKCGSNAGLIPSNYVEENMETVDNPLHEAAKRGNVSFMRECLANKVSVNGLDKAGSTPLHWAAHGGHVECLQMLLAQPKCEINVQNKLGDTPLHSAAWKGHAECVSLLLEKGAIKDLRNEEGKIPYDMAARNPEAAKQLKVIAAQYSADYGDEEDSD